MGLSGFSFGLVGGFILFALPQALAARRVSEVTIASITALAISPGFFSFLASPVLDVWFSRRAYALALITTSAVLVGTAVLLFDHLLLLRIVTLAAFAAIELSYSALGGWLSTVSGKDNENQLGAWLTVSNVSGFGTMALLGGELIRRLPARLSGISIACLILLPVLIFLWIPAPGPDRRLAGESFRAFWADVFALFRRRDVLVGIALFVAPCATFSLTNMLGGFGSDFAASPRAVGLLGGIGSVAAGVCGSLLLPILARRMRLRPLYLTIGAVGVVFTLLVLLLPRVVWSFALAVIGQNIFQSLAVACSIAICFEIMGQDNPLAATNFAIFSAAYNMPIAYMLIVDGWGYGRWGVTGAFAVDACVGALACLLLGLLLLFVYRGRANHGVLLARNLHASLNVPE
jgi:MFS transporter, PAT family, beta-lactamase induction signal transducer AmpG